MNSIKSKVKNNTCTIFAKTEYWSIYDEFDEYTNFSGFIDNYLVNNILGGSYVQADNLYDDKMWYYKNVIADYIEEFFDEYKIIKLFGCLMRDISTMDIERDLKYLKVVKNNLYSIIRERSPIQYKVTIRNKTKNINCGIKNKYPSRSFTPRRKI